MHKIHNNLLNSNTKFWNKANHDNGEFLLYETFYEEINLVYGISKVALTIANIKKLTPLCIKPFKKNIQRDKLIQSMNSFIIGRKIDILKSVIPNIFQITKIIRTLNNKEDILNLELNNCNIGKYLYDAILRTYQIPTIDKIDRKIISKVIVELCYFFYFEKIITSKRIKIIVTGDNVYRYGFLFELAKIYNITCVSPINLNTLSLKKHTTHQDFDVFYRRPSLTTLNQIDIITAKTKLDTYFSNRFNAEIKQHDVLSAFDKRKKIYTKNELIRKYSLNSELPIVIVMAHIFCDAPHSYPDLLYYDYKEWFIKTITSLKKNKQINFLIKKHPSSNLYNEHNTIEYILDLLGLKQHLLDEDINNITILNECDTVVTCGGTIGLEFLYKGKPVVVAAKPAYSGFGLTIDTDNKENYEKFLISGIERVQKLSAEQKDLSIKIIYHDFVLLNNYSDDLELGGQQTYVGCNIDLLSFYEKIILDNDTEISNQNIYKVLEKFINQEEKNLIRSNHHE